MANNDTFKCGICGSTQYSAVKSSNNIDGPGFQEWVKYYYCNGCTTHFSDPTLFSKNRPRRKNQIKSSS